MLRYESHTVEGRIGPNVLTLFYLLPHAKTINNSPQQCRTMSIFCLGIPSIIASSPWWTGPLKFLFQEGVEHPNRECRILEADHCQHPANGNLDQLLVREQVPCNFCRRGCGVGWPKT